MGLINTMTRLPPMRMEIEHGLKLISTFSSCHCGSTLRYQDQSSGAIRLPRRPRFPCRVDWSIFWCRASSSVRALSQDPANRQLHL